jgi:hypothetical protein
MNEVVQQVGIEVFAQIIAAIIIGSYKLMRK